MSKIFQVGVIDVGAHSVRLELFEVGSGGKATLLESLSRSINLGYDVFRHGSVSPENLAMLSSVMADFARKLDEYKVKFHRVVGTSAIREAFNRELVINRVRNASGLKIEILETQEETRITFHAMRETLRKHIPFDQLNGLCLVVGTGSLLVSYFAGGKMRFTEGIPLGTFRLADAFGAGGDSLGQTLEILRSQDIRQRLHESVGLEPGTPVTLIAMGASVRLLTEGSASSMEEGAGEVLELSGEKLAALVQRTVALDSEELAAKLNVSASRAASTAVCAGILSYFLEEFECGNFISPGITTRDALIRELTREKQKSDPFYEDLLAVCEAIGHKYGYDPVHAAEVSRISQLFLEKLRRNFDFDQRAEVLLAVASQLHDIGRFVDTRQHHKHSAYLVRSMQLPGVSEAEQKVVAEIARYHRKGGPAEAHREYMALSAEEKVTVLKLAAILRVADALDCSRSCRFKHMKLQLRGPALIVQVRDSGDFRAERSYLQLKGELFTEVFGFDLKIEELPEI